MTLRTLGGLSVEGMTFRREKVLLLLAYLCLEGPQPRRRLAEVFWPEAANPMNSLAQHLVHLRGLPGALAEDGQRVAAGMPCDAAQLRDAARRGRAADASAVYRGAFLDGLSLALGADLEEWVYETREALALEARAALLTLASQAAARGARQEAGDYAARALGLPGAPPADELDLPKLHHFLTLAGHPLASQVERDARTLGLDLDTAPQVDAAPFVGRTHELETLGALTPGQLAWISGHAGMGKTALLEALARMGGWTVLPGRADLPYGTLAPLCSAPPASAHAALIPLRDPHLRLAIDGWEGTDEATRAVVAQAAQTRPGAVVVVTSRTHPPFDVDAQVQLQPLSAGELGDQELHGRTDGHPVLVGAALRGQPLDLRLGARVRAYPPATRDAFLLLALQDQPNLRATRAALGLTADDFARTLSFLTTEGLTGETGRVYAAAATREHLHQIHVHAALLHLKLARALPEADAWPHYERARDLWEDHDEARAARAACLRAQTLLKRGYPGPAATLLDTLRDVPSLAVPHAWALIGVGRYNEAYERLEGLPGQAQWTPEALAVRATILVRLGRSEEAVELAEQIKGSGPEAAHAASVKAHAAGVREQWEESRRYSQLAADLWQANGDEERELTELVMAARARVWLGAEAYMVFREVLQASQHLPSVQGLALVNLAQVLLERGQADQASELMRQAVEVLQLSGDHLGLASALGNLGVCRHLQGHVQEAAHLYKQAMHYLRGTGNVRHLGQTLTNLSELEGDLSAFEDSLHMLEQAGQHELVAQIRRNAHIVAQGTVQPLRS